MLQIGLDYDDTYTESPALFDKLIKLFIDDGHYVAIITARNECDPVNHKFNIPVIYCNGNKKRQFAEQAGFSVDIWIDDMPWII